MRFILGAVLCVVALGLPPARAADPVADDELTVQSAGLTT
jgi:hypothetical protein